METLTKRLIKISPEEIPQDIVDEVNKCISCGKCLVDCTVYKATGKTRHLPLKKTKILWKIINKIKNLSPYFFGSQPIETALLSRSIEKTYACTLCGYCSYNCQQEIPTRKLWETLRSLMYRQGYIPDTLKEIDSGFRESKDPYNMGTKMRTYWVKREKLRNEVPVNKEAEVLYFVGCTTAFKRDVRPVAKATTKILNYVNEDWAILGENEWCCGSPWLMMGNREKAKEHVIHNVEVIEALGIKKVITTCATCYRAIKLEYPEILGRQPEFQVLHAVELLNQYIKQGKIKLKKTEKKITYHDPCELARFADVINSPREILENLTSNFKEMKQNKKETYCCGGGGLLQATYNDIRLRMASYRVNQAKKTGSEILTSACPSCKMSLLDGEKQIKAGVEVKDIMELIAENLGLL